ncbi:MAG: BA14K family protein [Rhizobiales bacterium]|nr:BA14K family protein [Hyphomicrobiales bacterium]
MIIKRLRVFLVAMTAAMLALPELVMPVAAMPLAQPGVKPALDRSSLTSNVEPVAYRRKIKRGGYQGYRGPRYGNRSWNGKRYGYNNRYWRNNRYGYNRGWYGKRYGWNNGWCRYGRCRPYYKYKYYNNPWPWIAAGAAVGYAGAYYYDNYYDDGPYYGTGGYDAHVQWCLNRYRSYDPRTDTYLGYDGYRHRCRAPY